MRRRALLAASMPSGGAEEIFPIHINLVKISSDEYRADPTPESIAFCKYFKNNAVFDGTAAWDLTLKLGELYIDDIEVQRISNLGDSLGNMFGNSAWWYPYHPRYDNFVVLVFHIAFEDGYNGPEGAFVAFNDD